MKLSTKLALLILPAIGISMLVAAVFFAINTQKFIETSGVSEGEVITFVEKHSDGSTMYAPVVVFNDLNGNNFEFVSKTSSTPPAYRVGESVGVFYDLNNPNEALINSFFSVWGASVIFGVLGGVFSIIGFTLIAIPVLKSKKAKYLLAHGEKVSAEFIRVEINDNIAVNGRSPYRIVTQWLEPNSEVLYTYKSYNLWVDPAPHIKCTHLAVYIDKNKPKKHFLDTSFLP